MLPGFRFIFATVVLSFSVLIFGLGAAALLRSAHEEFVGVPAWRAAQQPLMPTLETARPSLALLRVEPAAPAIIESKNEMFSGGENTPQVDKRPEPKTASLDTQATGGAVAEQAVAAEKTPNIKTEDVKTEDIKKKAGKPRIRQAKRARVSKTIRHWTARVQPQQAQQPQLFGGGATSAFPGFETPAAPASGGTGRNRRSATNSPF